MSVDMYLKVDGAVGESKDANHKEWSDLISLDWGASQPGSMTTGGGGGIGKVRAVAEAECNTVTGLKQVHHAATPLPLS
ncbi:type VI secretion system tube protein Hcp [Pseudomonas sp. AU12215]|uniref:type VI secretion system tube protein Hcp n=1 Tax=Pseudomonas sp. AU12215 TaxID=1860123 RepID=UPI000806E995|nr:type VI secretion system tube protein Hcp [Pseudomonas sp. AU12215]OBY59026.1 hypothetical protein A9513_007460 [Pseudomonas sp. AU12215]